jgi:transglutaminase-like putative cysteine protease
MLLYIRHTTEFHYDKPSYQSHNELRLTPRSSPGQRCLEARLEVIPKAAVVSFDDAFRNRVHAINVHAPHLGLTILAESVVERSPPRTLATPRVRFSEFLADDLSRSTEYFEFLQPARYVPFSTRLRRFFWSSRPAPSEPVVDYVSRIVKYIHDQMEYEKGTTHVHSSVDDILREGGGVCQDFAHLGLGMLRLAGIPARYVSGYLAPAAGQTQGEQASHAWLEVMLPGTGWTGFDPTLGGPTSDRHVRVAVGRDYEDVPPIRGVYRNGGGTAHMAVDLSIEPAEGGPPAEQ